MRVSAVFHFAAAYFTHAPSPHPRSSTLRGGLPYSTNVGEPEDNLCSSSVVWKSLARNHQSSRLKVTLYGTAYFHTAIAECVCKIGSTVSFLTARFPFTGFVSIKIDSSYSGSGVVAGVSTSS